MQEEECWRVVIHVGVKHYSTWPMVRIQRCGVKWGNWGSNAAWHLVIPFRWNALFGQGMVKGAADGDG